MTSESTAATPRCPAALKWALAATLLPILLSASSPAWDCTRFMLSIGVLLRVDRFRQLLRCYLGFALIGIALIVYPTISRLIGRRVGLVAALLEFGVTVAALILLGSGSVRRWCQDRRIAANHAPP